MDFYKILKAEKSNINFLFNYLNLLECKYINGKCINSFAIKYSPESYNALLNDDKLFNIFQDCSVQQLFVTNQKYLAISKYNDFFDFELRDCKFDEDDGDYFLEELGEVSLEDIEYLTDNYHFKIKQIVYITKESKRQIILQKNGVIGIDNGLNDIEYDNVLKFIDTLNLGLRTIKNEKNYV